MRLILVNRTEIIARREIVVTSVNNGNQVGWDITNKDSFPEWLDVNIYRGSLNYFHC